MTEYDVRVQKPQKQQAAAVNFYTDDNNSRNNVYYWTSASGHASFEGDVSFGFPAVIAQLQADTARQLYYSKELKGHCLIS